MDLAPTPLTSSPLPAPPTPDGAFSQRRIDRAVRNLAERHEDAARLAETAFARLTGGRGLEALTRARLQRYLWHDLPVETPPERRAQVCTAAVDAVARVFDALEEHGYAAVCRSAATLDALRAWEGDDGTGPETFARLQDRSGAEPVDTGSFRWSARPGEQERAARHAASRALQTALDHGELQPGAAGWRRRRRLIVDRALDTPAGQPVPSVPPDDPDLEVVDWRERLRSARPLTTAERLALGPTWRRRVEAERLEAWSESRGPTRRRLMRSVLRRLATPSGAPEGAVSALAPLRWLLSSLDDGVATTSAGRLPPELVAAAVSRFGWRVPGGRRPRSETDVWQLEETRALAAAIGAIERDAGRISATARGRLLRRDIEGLWTAVARQVTSEGGWRGRSTETTLVRLVTASGPVTRDDLCAMIGRVAAEEGWRTSDGSAPDPWALDAAVMIALSTLRLLGLLREPPGGGGTRSIGLTPDGRSFALAALRAAGVAPAAPAGRDGDEVHRAADGGSPVMTAASSA